MNPVDKFIKNVLHNKIYGAAFTAFCVVITVFMVWGGPSGVKHDAKVIQNSVSDNSAPASKLSDEKRAEIKRLIDSKPESFTSEEKADTTASYVAEKPETPAVPVSQNGKTYQFHVSENTGYKCLTTWLDKHHGLTAPGGNLEVDRKGGVVLYGGSKGYYIYSISGIRGREYPLIVLVDDANGELWYSTSMQQLGAYDKLDVWYGEYIRKMGGN